jgi:hypothetical protein
MARWDEICLICALRPDGGPRQLYNILSDWLDKIPYYIQRTQPDLDLDEDELCEEIRRLLLMFDVTYDDEPTGYEIGIKEGHIPSGPYFPFTYEKWDGWKPMVIGDTEQLNQSREDIDVPITPATNGGYVSDI